MQNFIKFITNAVANIINGSANAVFALVLPPLLLQRMSLDEYSLWVYCLQTGALIGYLNLGVQTAVGRYVALYDGNKGNVLKTIKLANKILYGMFFIGIAIAIALGFFINDLVQISDENLQGLASKIIIIVSAGYAVSLLMNSYFGYFIGLRKNHIPMWVNLISKIILGILVVSLASHGLLTVSVVFLIVNIATTLVSFLLWRFTVPLEQSMLSAQDKSDYKNKKQFIHFCIGLSVWNLGMLLVNGMNTSIVGYYSFNDVAYFAMANGIVMALVGFVSTGLNPLIQVFTSQYAKGDCETSVKIIYASTRVLSLFMLLAFIFYFAVRDVFLFTWLQHDYAVHVGSFIDFLIISACIRVLNIPYALALIATGNQNKALLGALVEGLINITLGIVLCSTLGAKYITVAMIISSIVATLYNVLVNVSFTGKDIPIKKLRLFSFESACLFVAIAIHQIIPWMPYFLAIMATGYALLFYPKIIREFR